MRQAMLAVVVLSATVLASGTNAGATSGLGRDGRVLYSEAYQYAYGSGFLYAVNPNGSGRVLITNNAINGSWSPDGKRILFETSRKGDLDLWTINADGSGLQQLTSNPGTEENPAWSPNGGQIAYDSDDGDVGNLDIWVMSSNGTNQRHLISSPALDALPDWSPDSKQIVFASERSGKTNRKIYIANANGSNVHLLTGAAQRGRLATLPSWGVHPTGDSCTIEGTVHADQLTGTKGADVICGGGGNDVIHARDGKRDVIDGGPGRDTVYADKIDTVRHVEKVLYR